MTQRKPKQSYEACSVGDIYGYAPVKVGKQPAAEHLISTPTKNHQSESLMPTNQTETENYQQNTFGFSKMNKRM